MVGKVEESAKEVERIKVTGGTTAVRTGMATAGIHLLTSKDSLHCSICGKDMIDPITGAAFIGMSFKISVDPNSVNCDSNLAFFKKQLGVYGCLLEKDSPALIDLCWECWFKGLGIIPWLVQH